MRRVPYRASQLDRMPSATEPETLPHAPQSPPLLALLSASSWSSVRFVVEQVDLYQYNQFLKRQAFARFQNQALFAGFRIWREARVNYGNSNSPSVGFVKTGAERSAFVRIAFGQVHPPRMFENMIAGPLRQRVAELEKKLLAELDAHDKLRRASARLFAEKDYVRETAKQCARHSEKSAQMQ